MNLEIVFGGYNDEQKAHAIRLMRDERLRLSDWIVTRAAESQSPVPLEWVAYRRALRDITSQPGFPRDIKWPAEPLG